MISLSLQIKGHRGLTWPLWQRLVEQAEAFGFAGLFRSDHFTGAQPPDKASLELIVSLTYVADHTKRIHFGSLVAPVSFRHPIMLARQAAALDDLSDGRMILGVGAGWQEREHQLFGYPLGDLPTRMARLEEGLEVITRLLRSDEPVSYEGRFYQLHGAQLLPRPHHPGGPRILVGGHGTKRTLRLAACYADIWNAISLAPDTFRERSTTLDELLHAVGRRPSEVRRTMMTKVYFGRDMPELARRLKWRRRLPELAGKPLDVVIETLHTGKNAIVGTPDIVGRQVRAYEEAGVEELILQWPTLDDMDGLEALATSISSQA